MNDKEKLEEIDKIILGYDKRTRIKYTDEEKLEQIYRILHSTKNYEESPA